MSGVLLFTDLYVKKVNIREHPSFRCYQLRQVSNVYQEAGPSLLPGGSPDLTSDVLNVFPSSVVC